MFLGQGWRGIRDGIPVSGRFRQEGVTKGRNPLTSGIKARLGRCIIFLIARDAHPEGGWRICGAETCAERFPGFSSGDKG
jgi:hypothetical protein